jgi:hypothetical protein
LWSRPFTSCACAEGRGGTGAAARCSVGSTTPSVFGLRPENWSSTTMDIESLVDCFCDFAESIIRCLIEEYEDDHEHEADIGIKIRFYLSYATTPL